VKIGIVVFLVAVAGTFSGHMGWQWYQQRAAAEKAAAEAAAAEARKTEPIEIQREAVRRALADPDSAIFRNERPALRGKGAWCGEVNARNRMGGMVGFTRYISEPYEDPTVTALNRVQIEPTSIIGESAQREAEGFRNAWRLYCQ
jgi:hypothetical protein